MQVLTGIVDLLHPEDAFAITLFSSDACTPKPFGPVSCVDVPALKAQVGRQTGMLWPAGEERTAAGGECQRIWRCERGPSRQACAGLPLPPG